MQKYKKDLSKYALGRRVNMEEWNTRTGVAAGAIGFAVPVQAGPLGGRQVSVWDGESVILGVTEASVVLPRPGDAYVQFDNLAFCESGVLGVDVTGPVTKDAPAFFDTATGKWTATGSATALAVLGATFDEAGANAIVPLRYRRPNGTVAAPADPDDSTET